MPEALRVLVGSTNPVKIAAAREAFSRYFGPVTVEGIAVEPGVPAQPVGGQTFVGAENRARALSRFNAERGRGARFCVGIEGGMLRLHERWFALGCMCIVDDQGRAGFGTTGLFELPEAEAREMAAGTEMGLVIDRLAGERDTKRRGGAVGYLTGGAVDRQALYVQGLLLALIPFLNAGLYR